MDNDLTNRTVVLDGDIDQMGVVVRDDGGERVKVWFHDRPLTRVHYLDGADYIDRSRLEDVTDEDDPAYNLAVAWGLVEDEEDED